MFLKHEFLPTIIIPLWINKDEFSLEDDVIKNKGVYSFQTIPIRMMLKLGRMKSSRELIST